MISEILKLFLKIPTNALKKAYEESKFISEELWDKKGCLI